MPTINTSVQVKGDPNQILDMLVKAAISAGLEANQMAENIVVAKRGMTGMSWGVEINLSFMLENDNNATVQIQGNIGGYGPIQKAELQKCIDAICNSLYVQQASSRKKEVPSSQDTPEATQINSPIQKQSISQSLTMTIGATSLDTNIAYLMKEMSSQERILFQNEYSANKKSVTTGVLLALFVGGLGIHKFWLGETGIGILYLLFFWSFIPALVAILDACLMGNTIKNYNLKVANAAYQKIIMMR